MAQKAQTPHKVSLSGTNSLRQPKLKEVRKITVGWMVGWLFGALFLLMGATYLKQPGAGIPFILASFVLLPPINQMAKDKFNFELSRGLKIILVIILLGIAFSSVPTSTTPYSTQIETQPTTGAAVGAPTAIPTATTTSTSVSSSQQTAQPKNQKEITISHSSSTQPYLLVVGNGPGTSGTIEASAGKEFLVVKATITNNGYDTFAVNPYSFTIVINSVKYDIDTVNTLMVGNRLDSVELLNGGSTTGSIVFEIPSNVDAQDYQLKYDETCLFNCHEFVYK